MSDIEAMVAWLNGVLDDDERVARDAASPMADRVWRVTAAGGLAQGGYLILQPHHAEVSLGSLALAHIALHDPAHELNVVAAHRAIIAEVMSWQHFYLDEDGWHSCSQAVDPSEPNAEPGSGCLDDERRGKPCDCGLDRRRMAILGPLAAGYAGRDGYREEWGRV